jgi:hypothetical protein
MAKKIRAYVRTNISGSRIECDYDAPDDWDQLSAVEQEGVLNEIAEAHVQNNASYGAYEVEES